MTNDLNDLDAVRFEKIIDEHKGHLKRIEDGIVEGVQEGVKEGVAEGLKDGVKDGLKEGLKEGFDKGFINIGEGDSKDIIDKITEGIIIIDLEERAEYSIERGVKEYLQGVCGRFIDEIRHKDIKLSKNQVKEISTLIKRTEKEAEERIKRKLQNNFFYRASVEGIKAALEESFEKNGAECEERIYKEIKKQEE